MVREATNSITHLVKIVAQEVVDENIAEMRAAQRAEQSEIAKEIRKVLDERLKGIESDLSSAYSIWQEEEDKIFEAEVRLAMQVLAKRHNRSYGAIKERLVKLVKERL